jgi:DNA-binding NarL/FixJ family response regulator
MDGLRENLLESRTQRAQVLVAVTAPLMWAAAEACLQEHGFAASYGGGADAATVIESAVREQPDVALIDADLPGGGINIAAEVVSAAPGVAVVILAERPTGADVVEAFRAGAVGCLPKHISLHGLARAVSGVLRGEAALPRTLVSAALTEALRADARMFLGGLPGGLSELTVRELDVLRLLADGSSTAEIARQLTISPITARRHCAGICRKLNVPDRASAVEVVKRSRLPLASHAT